MYEPMNVRFGKHQVRTSRRMRNHPAIGALIHRIFGYTNIGNYARFTVFRDLLRQLPIRSFDSMLDLGCGYGEYAFCLAEAFPDARLTALDIDAARMQTVERVKKQARLSNLHPHVGPIESLPQEALFDFIYTVDVFEHLLPEEMPFADCWHRLRPGGYLLVKIPAAAQHTVLPEAWFDAHHDWLEEEHHGQVYDLDGLVRRFETERFTVIHASYSDGRLSRVAWELAYLAKQAGAVPHLLSLPIAKYLIHIDRRTHQAPTGNAIQVIGRKPV